MYPLTASWFCPAPTASEATCILRRLKASSSSLCGCLRFRLLGLPSPFVPSLSLCQLLITWSPLPATGAAADPILIHHWPIIRVSFPTPFQTKPDDAPSEHLEQATVLRAPSLESIRCWSDAEYPTFSGSRRCAWRQVGSVFMALWSDLRVKPRRDHHTQSWPRITLPLEFCLDSRMPGGSEHP